MRAEGAAASDNLPFRLRIGHPLLPVLLLAAAGIAAYFNSLQVPFQFDDPWNITDRAFIRDLRSFLSWDIIAQPRSFTYFTFALNYRLHQANVFGYHLVNLAVHVINGALLYRIILLFFQTPLLRATALRSRAPRIALFSSLLFVCHPLQTQAVTYIVQRLASLAALFCLASLAAYLAWRLTDEGSRRTGARWGWYALSVISAVIAMKCKETAFTLPFVIGLAEMLFFSGPFPRRVLLLAPLMLTLLIIPATMVHGGASAAELINDVSSATRLETDIARSEYLLTQFTVIVTYLRLLFFPAGQILDYDYPVHHSLSEPAVFLSLLLLASILGGAAHLLCRERRSPSAGRLVVFGILWFFLFLAVESSVIPIADVIFEHRLYLPSAGFFTALITALFWKAASAESARPAVRRILYAGLAAAVAACLGLTIARNSVWRSEVSLWSDVIEKSPLKARGYNGLGLAYLHRGEYGAALQTLARAVSLDPGYGSAFNNLGSAFYHLGRYEDAVEAHSRAIMREPKNAVFRDNRGISLMAAGAYDRAAMDFLEAAALDPSYAKAHHNLGSVRQHQGRLREAIESYSRAISLEGDNDVFLTNRGLAYARLGDRDNAIRDYSQALLLNPAAVYALSGRGEVYGSLRRYEEAVVDFTAALALDPSRTVLYFLRGTAYARTDRRSDAQVDFDEACRRGSDKACNELQRFRRL